MHNSEFQIKTNSSSIETSKPHFYILNKGLNSGKPLVKPCPNCFILIAKNPELKEQLYWLCYALWQSKSLHYYLRGSVIPFITIKEFEEALTKSFLQAKSYPNLFNKTIKSVRSLETAERKYSELLRLIKESKKVITIKFLCK